MFTRRFALSLIGGALIMAAATSGRAQEVVVTGPPPALRRNLDAFQKAFNSGDAAQFETMAKDAFAPENFKRQTADDRKKAYAKWHADFGTIKFERVERRGPDAPLQIFFKGSVASGVMWMDLDDSSRIDSVKVEGEKKAEAEKKKE